MIQSRLQSPLLSMVLKPGFLFPSILLLCLLAATVGCTKNTASTQDATSPADAQKAALTQRGRVLYQTQCIACHNADPHKSGALGPDVFNSSKELLEARLLRAEYPAGYKPKRETHTMVAMPHLKNEVDAIHAFLNN